MTICFNLRVVMYFIKIVWNHGLKQKKNKITCPLCSNKLVEN